MYASKSGACARIVHVYPHILPISTCNQLSISPRSTTSYSPVMGPLTLNKLGSRLKTSVPSLKISNACSSVNLPSFQKCSFKNAGFGTLRPFKVPYNWSFVGLCHAGSGTFVHSPRRDEQLGTNRAKRNAQRTSGACRRVAS